MFRVQIPSFLQRNREQLLRETTEPASAGELVFQSLIDEFSETLGFGFSTALIKFVWVAERCLQLVSQNIKQMPLMFAPGAPNSREPAWLSVPDPVWYPNGIRDAMFSAVDSYYRFGDAFLLINSTYADGFASGWTVMDATRTSVEVKGGRRIYKVDEVIYGPDEVVQVSRNPRGMLRGTSALQAYAEIMNGMLRINRAAADSVVNNPLSILQSKRPLDADQAAALQTAWSTAGRARTPGAPAILPPELTFEAGAGKLGFSPEELMLVDVQEFDARVLASACGVPPFLLNIALTGGLTYQNPAMLGEYWWRTELSATCDAFESAFTSRMLPAGSSVWFDPNHLIGPLSSQGEAESSPVVKASPADLPSSPADNVIPLQEAIA